MSLVLLSLMMMSLSEFLGVRRAMRRAHTSSSSDMCVSDMGSTFKVTKVTTTYLGDTP